MTIYGHNVVMNKNNNITVRIAEFKARLSQYLRNVRQGHPITILDRDTPIATVLPSPGKSGRLLIRKPSRTAKEVHLPPPLQKRVASLSALLEERQVDR